jgi:hypothetical protein
MKSETKIAEELRRSREKVKQLKRERDAAKRRRIAVEQKCLDRHNLLLGRALVMGATSKTLENLKGHVGRAKLHLVHCVTKKTGEVVEDDTDFRELMAYLDEMLSSKEVDTEGN